MQTAFDANTADAERVARWLGTALDSHLNDDMGRWAFEPFEDHIGQRDSLAEDLRSIYASLRATAQARWRMATRDLLAMRGRDVSQRASTNVLVDFGVLIRAPEVLDVLPGLLAGEQGDAMLNRAVRAATALAADTEASRNCLERIRASSAFTADYAGLVLVSLCHADPDNWLRHVEDLAVPMQQLAGKLLAESTALRFYAANILDTITLSRVTSGALNQLSALAAKEPCWLLHEWFHGQQSLLRLERETATTWRLVLRADESVSKTLDGTFDAAMLEETAHASQRAAIAWHRSSNGMTWVAVHDQGKLKELVTVQSIEEVRQRIEVMLAAWTAAQHIGSWPMQHQTAGIAFAAFAGIAPRVVNAEALLARWDSHVPNQRTARASYLRPYRDEIQPSLRRKAMSHKHAFFAAASSLALVHQPTSTQIAHAPD